MLRFFSNKLSVLLVSRNKNGTFWHPNKCYMFHYVIFRCNQANELDIFGTGTKHSKRTNLCQKWRRFLRNWNLAFPGHRPAIDGGRPVCPGAIAAALNGRKACLLRAVQRRMLGCRQATGARAALSAFASPARLHVWMVPPRYGATEESGLLVRPLTQRRSTSLRGFQGGFPARRRWGRPVFHQRARCTLRS